VAEVPTFEQVVLRLQRYWSEQGCALVPSMNTEVGAGTMNPATFLMVLGPRPWRTAYLEPSVRPDDSRYGENPNRIQTHLQFQVILKPDPGDPQELYVRSLEAIGIDTQANDIRFVEDNWESPALGAWGLGWEVWLNGLEITQFTYFQQAGGLELEPVSVEITYGLERILMGLQGAKSFKDIQYADGVAYGDIFARGEYEMSVYYLDAANIDREQQLFEHYEQEALDMLDRGLVVPAYSYVLKTSHAFNVLDARGAVGVTERAQFFGRMRALSRRCAEMWLGEQAESETSSPAEESHTPSPKSTVGESEPRAFTLEVHTEELPPDDLVHALSYIGDAVVAQLDAAQLAHGDVEVAGTPRRLFVSVADVAPRQPVEQKDVRGPRADVAWDEAGTPTAAAEGFARRNGVTADALERVTVDGTEFASVRVEQGGAWAVDLLAAALPDVLKGLRFKRSMRWNSTGVAFSRPIRALVALLGDDAVPFAFAGLTAGRTTRLTRITDDVETVEIDSAENHRATLERRGIVLDVDARRERIRTDAQREAAAVGAELSPAHADAVLEEVTGMTEAPLVVRGDFDPKYLALPDEVLSTVMTKHQRYFPTTAGGRMAAHFVTVADGVRDVDTVRAGNESVIRARFADAEFFYQQDVSRPLESFRPELERLTFHERLGSMEAKVQRIEQLSAALAETLGIDDATRTVIKRAATLAKNDLATHMVVEFTSLAGTMGGQYARASGEPEAVAEAIADHVKPTSAEGDPPATLAGAVLAIADRLDTLVGMFGVGVTPRATADPFGLRRAANGLLQALIAHDLDLDLEDAVARAATYEPVAVDDETRAQVLDFIWRRLDTLMAARALKRPAVQAAVASRSASPALKWRVAGELDTLIDSEAFARTHEALQRAHRISRDTSPHAPIDRSLLAADAEIALADALEQVEDRARAADTVAAFIDAFGPLVEPIERFFDEVFVMDEDEAVAGNRLALLRRIADLPAHLADLAGTSLEGQPARTTAGPPS
jgi:glycyl-tRNA synthetase